MNPDRWREAELIFQDAADLPANQRDEFLTGRCAGDTGLRQMVEALLAHQRSADDPVADAVGAAAALWVEQAADPVIGRRFGPYRVTGYIGHGGMGSVYQAVRDDEFTKTVAIKIIKRGMDTDAIVQRFRTERQILATLEHPNIARLYDGGSTDDGVPYFVMEYIDGRPITEYCREQALAIRQRLELFRSVCHAVEHAHKNLIVHRDLKPTNILVTADGTPKLLDFGIAKMLDAEAPATITASDARAFTPDYGSPEQVMGQAMATTTDVYSLGAVLYEILTGARAHRLADYTPQAVTEAVCHTDVVLASAAVTDPAASRELVGDLDNILAHALQKEPARRYQSAAAFADDIRRFLEDLPVQARPDTRIYRAGKFARRHRVMLSATTAVFVALVIGGLVALQQARVARARELQVRELAKVFMFDIHDSIRDLPGATKARQRIVETAVQYLDALAASSPTETELRRELVAGYMRVGDIQGATDRGANLGDLKGARSSYEKALSLLDQRGSAAGDDRQSAIDRVRALRQLAEIDAREAGTRASVASGARAGEAAEELVRRYPDDGAVRDLAGDVLMLAARRQRDGGDLEAALRTSTRALDVLARAAAAAPADVDAVNSLASAESELGMTEARLGHLREAAQHYERAVAVGERLVQLEPDSVNRRRSLMIAYSHVGDVLGLPSLPNLGDAAGAEAVYAKMIALARQLHEADANDARSATDYAIALMRLGSVIPAARSPEKQARLEQSSTLLHGLLERTPDNVALRLNVALVDVELGHVLRDRGEPLQAARYYRRVLVTTGPVLEAGNIAPLYSYTVAVRELAKLEGAGREATLALVNDALQVVERHIARQNDPGALEPRILIARLYGALMTAHAGAGHGNEAAAWCRKALALWDELSASPRFTSQARREMEAFKAGLGPSIPP